MGLFIAFLLLFGILHLEVLLGQQGGETFFSNPLLALSGLASLTAGILAFFTGIFSIIKSKERSIFVYIATAIGALVLIFILGEIFCPH